MNKSEMTPRELEKFMAKHRLSDHEFADIIGVTKPAIDHWIAGRRSIPATTARLIRYFDKHPTAMDEFETMMKGHHT